MSIRYLPNSPPPFEIDRKARAARWAAAKADYLAGGSAPEVCELHGLKLSTFRYHAKQGGWRRADQPAPFIAPDPEPAPAPPVQNDPLVIPDAPPGASRDAQEHPAPPLTAAQMADKAWSMLQAAVAAGRLIQARGWMRLYKDLQPFVREEADAERRARLNREAAEQHARLTALAPGAKSAGETRETQLDCFSGDAASPSSAHPSEGWGPDHKAPTLEDGPHPTIRPPAPAIWTPASAGVSGGCVESPKPLPIKALSDHARALERETMRLSLDCFSGSGSKTPGPGP